MRRTIAAIAGGLALVIAACGTAPEVPQDQYFRITVAAPRPVAKPALPGVVSVEQFAATGLTGTRPIIYTRRNDPNRLTQYNYQFWIEPPTTMVRDLLVTYLRGARLAGQVVTPELRVEPAFVVRGRINRFEQVMGGNPGIVVDLDITVQETATDRVVHMKTYHVERPTPDESLSAAVDAFGSALSEVFAGFVQAVAAGS